MDDRLYDGRLPAHVARERLHEIHQCLLDPHVRLRRVIACYLGLDALMQRMRRDEQVFGEWWPTPEGEPDPTTRPGDARRLVAEGPAGKRGIRASCSA